MKVCEEKCVTCSDKLPTSGEISAGFTAIRQGELARVVRATLPLLVVIARRAVNCWEVRLKIALTSRVVLLKIELCRRYKVPRMNLDRKRTPVSRLSTVCDLKAFERALSAQYISAAKEQWKDSSVTWLCRIVIFFQMKNRDAVLDLWVRSVLLHESLFYSTERRTDFDHRQDVQTWTMKAKPFVAGGRTTKITLFRECRKQWSGFCDVLLKYSREYVVISLSEPLSYSYFVTLWKYDSTEIRIVKHGSDYCLL